MDSVFISSLLLASFIGSFLVHLVFGRPSRADGTLPPGSMGLPLIGETRELLTPHSPMSPGPFMEKHRLRYGKVFKTSLFGRPTVVSTDPELNKTILQNEDRLFQLTFPSSVGAILGEDSMFWVHGDAHKHLRSFALEFFRFDLLKEVFLEDIERHVSSILRSWQNNSSFSALEEAKKLTFNVVAHKVLSLRLGDPDLHFFYKEIHTLLEALISIPINFPGTKYNKALKSRKRILNRLKEILAQRKQQPEREYDDLLQRLLKENSLSDEQTIELVLTMLLGSYETTPSVITLSLKLLAESPEALQDLRIEHERIRAMKNEEDQRLCWEDYRSMCFTQCVINETLRLGSITRFVIRESLQDVTYKGFTIPKDWQVVTSFSVIHLDEAHYKEPGRFLPRRWQEQSSNTYFTPFSGGARMCPASNFAKLVIAVFLHYLVLEYDWKLVEPDDPILNPQLVFPKGLPITVSKKWKNFRST